MIQNTAKPSEKRIKVRHNSPPMTTIVNREDIKNAITASNIPIKIIKHIASTAEKGSPTATKESYILF